MALASGPLFYSLDIPIEKNETAISKIESFYQQDVNKGAEGYFIEKSTWTIKMRSNMNTPYVIENILSKTKCNENFHLLSIELINSTILGNRIDGYKLKIFKDPTEKKIIFQGSRHTNIHKKIFVDRVEKLQKQIEERRQKNSESRDGSESPEKPGNESEAKVPNQISNELLYLAKTGENDTFSMASKDKLQGKVIPIDCLNLFIAEFFKKPENKKKRVKVNAVYSHAYQDMKKIKPGAELTIGAGQESKNLFGEKCDLYYVFHSSFEITENIWMTSSGKLCENTSDLYSEKLMPPAENKINEIKEIKSNAEKKLKKGEFRADFEDTYP